MRLRIVVLAFVALAAVSLTAALAWAVSGGRDRDTPSAYQRLLRAKVDDAHGAPRRDRDPTARRQRGLAEAARQRVGTGNRGGKPARSIKPGKLRRRPQEVLPRSRAVLAGGCVLGYGTAGDQCLPPRAPHNRPMTCTYAVTLFRAGLPVTGHDVLQLDTNEDGRACGRGDRGLPAAAHPHHPQSMTPSVAGQQAPRRSPSDRVSER